MSNSEANQLAISKVIDWLKWHGVDVRIHKDHYTIHETESGKEIGRAPDLAFVFHMALDHAFLQARADARRDVKRAIALAFDPDADVEDGP